MSLSTYAGAALVFATIPVVVFAGFELVGSYWESHGRPRLRDLIKAGCLWKPLLTAAAVEAWTILSDQSLIIMLFWGLGCWMFAVRSFGKRAAA
jgi:hypothetical protein